LPQSHSVFVWLRAPVAVQVGEAGKQPSAKIGAAPRTLAGQQEDVAPAAQGGLTEVGLFHVLRLLLLAYANWACRRIDTMQVLLVLGCLSLPGWHHVEGSAVLLNFPDAILVGKAGKQTSTDTGAAPSSHVGQQTDVGPCDAKWSAEGVPVPCNMLVSLNMHTCPLQYICWCL
jgi:hypothetical protein